MRTALFWAITQQEVVLITDVSGQPIGPIFRGQESKRKSEERSCDMGDIFCAINHPYVSYFVAQKKHAVPDVR